MRVEPQTAAELVAWTEGFLSGWARGRAEAEQQADRDLVRALAIALAGGDTTVSGYREAVRRHERSVDRARRREAADRGEVTA